MNDTRNAPLVFPEINKEPTFYSRKVEELCWLEGGKFDEEEINSIKRMLSIFRGTDRIDKKFIQKDTKDFEDAIRTFNDYGNRMQFLEEWIERKEYEIQNRESVPKAILEKTDKELVEVLDKKRLNKNAKLLESVTGKMYTRLTGEDLSNFVNIIGKKLHLFGNVYPDSLLKIIKALLAHPNLHREDKSALLTYSRIYNICLYPSQEMSLIYNPIRLEGPNLLEKHNTEGLIEDIKAASIRYYPILVKKLLNYP